MYMTPFLQRRFNVNVLFGCSHFREPSEDGRVRRRWWFTRWLVRRLSRGLVRCLARLSRQAANRLTCQPLPQRNIDAKRRFQSTHQCRFVVCAVLVVLRRSLNVNKSTNIFIINLSIYYYQVIRWWPGLCEKWKIQCIWLWCLLFNTTCFILHYSI